MKARVQDALKLPNLSPRSPRDALAAPKESVWDAVTEGVQKKARQIRVSLKEQKEAQQASMQPRFLAHYRDGDRTGEK